MFALLALLAGAVALHSAPADIVQTLETAAPRPFDHRRHEQLACAECHGTGDRHRTMLVRTPRDCAACHHDDARGFTCTSCHERSTLPERRAVEQSLELTVRDEPQVRDLPFGHGLHEDVECSTCHQASVMRAMSRECASCHDQHHGPEATCTNCHTSDPRPAHEAASHLSCGGGGCHAPEAAPSPATSRTLCILCHRAQRDHEAGSVCATCHQVPTPERVR